MKTTIPAMPAPKPNILTPRERLLQANGPGPRPCLDAQRNWLGCTHCELSCILAPGHQRDQKGEQKRVAAMKGVLKRPRAQRKLNRFEKHQQALRVKQRLAATRYEAERMDEVLEALPVADWSTLEVVCGICGRVMRPRGNRLFCPR